MSKNTFEYILFFGAIISLIFLSFSVSFVFASTAQILNWDGNAVDYKFQVRMDEKYWSWYQLNMEVEWDTEGYIIVGEFDWSLSKSWNGYAIGCTVILWGIQGDNPDIQNPGVCMDGWYKVNPWTQKDIDQWVCLYRYESTPYFFWEDEHNQASISHSALCASFYG